MRLRSKIVEIEAEFWEGTFESARTIEKFVGTTNFFLDSDHPLNVGNLEIWNKLEDQWIKCPKGHYVLKGLKGEFYPCEPEALWMKYEVIDD